MTLQSKKQLEIELLTYLRLHLQDIVPLSAELSTEDFSSENLSKLYQTMLTAASEDGKKETFGEVDFMNAFGESKEKDLIATSFTSNLTTEEPIEVAKTIHKLAVRDRAVVSIQKHLNELKKTTDPSDILGALQGEIEEQKESLIDAGDQSYEEKLDHVWEVWQTPVDQKDVFPTPYPSLNKYLNNGLGGMRRGQLMTVAARTGVGKTIFSTQFATFAAREGKNVLIFSLEVGMEELYKRVLASYGQIPLGAIEDPTCMKEEKKKAWDEVRKLPIYIDDTPGITMDKIRAIATKRNRQKQIDLIFIDYLQLIRGQRKSGQRSDEVLGDLSRASKILSRELNCTVVILVQLKRPDKLDDPNRLPSMNDIHGSSFIANDSDVVVILHKPKKEEDSLEENILVKLDKNRQGAHDRKFNVKAEYSVNLFIDKPKTKEEEKVQKDFDNFTDKELNLEEFDLFEDEN